MANERFESGCIITAKNGIKFEIEYKSKVVGPDVVYKLNGEEFVANYASYPSITELRYQKNEADNGKLILTASVMTEVGDNSTRACVMMSPDKGKSWECIARPREVLRPELGNVGSMAHIYELPVQLGDMPAGTLLYSYNSVNYGTMEDRKSGNSILAVWRSFDCGYTWEEYVIIDEAGGIREGVWEPFMYYCEEDGYLYCFYSDDSDPAHDQKISYKRSKDGVNWEGEGGKIGTGTGKDVEPVDVVSINKFEYRPGMPVITKMGNGEYFMVYEQFGDWRGCPIFYRKTKDLSNWGEANDIGIKIMPDMWSAPSCIWVDGGLEKGMLIVTSKGSSNGGFMAVSLDYGESWEKVEDPLASVATEQNNRRIGYSASFRLSSDGESIYYTNSTNALVDSESKQMVAFAKLKIKK